MSMAANHRAFIGLGTNLGNRLENLRAAQAALGAAAQVLAVSPVYQTPPWGYTDQPAFLNQVILIETALSPKSLLDFLKQVERDLGRQPTFRYGPRLIDLDILFFDDVALSLPGLTIPHPRLTERAFVLKPLADLAPDLRHPFLHSTIQELLANVEVAGMEVFSEAAHQEENDGFAD